LRSRTADASQSRITAVKIMIGDSLPDFVTGHENRYPLLGIMP
jgi:hypothetical protein